MFKILSDIANGIVEQRIDYSGISEAPATLVAAVCSELGVGEVTGVRIAQLILRAMTTQYAIDSQLRDEGDDFSDFSDCASA
jgi:hypothetical protein